MVWCNIWYPSETLNLQLNLAKTRSPITRLNNHIVLKLCTEILHKAQPYHCRALRKTSIRLDKCVKCCWRTRIREIWVTDKFRTDILDCSAPQAGGWSGYCACVAVPWWWPRHRKWRPFGVSWVPLVIKLLLAIQEESSNAFPVPEDIIRAPIAFMVCFTISIFTFWN